MSADDRLPGRDRAIVGDDGQIVETWATWNFLDAFQQLGVVEEPIG